MDYMLDTAARWRLAGLVLGMSATLMLGPFWPYYFGGSLSSFGTILGVPVFAAGVWLGVLSGEVTLPRPERRGATTAALQVRHVRDYLPEPAARGVVVLAGLLGIVLLVAMGGVFLFRDYPLDSYAGRTLLTTAVTVAVTLGLAWLVVVQVARSPRAGVEGEDLRRDEAWRRRTAHTITAACGVVLSGTLAGAVLFGSGVVGGPVTIPASFAASLLLVVFSGYVVMLLRPARSFVDAPIPVRETTSAAP